MQVNSLNSSYMRKPLQSALSLSLWPGFVLWFGLVWFGLVCPPIPHLLGLLWLVSVIYFENSMAHEIK